jgi:hypothetical protein
MRTITQKGGDMVGRMQSESYQVQIGTWDIQYRTVRETHLKVSDTPLEQMYRLNEKRVQGIESVQTARRRRTGVSEKTVKNPTERERGRQKRTDSNLVGQTTVRHHICFLKTM